MTNVSFFWRCLCYVSVIELVQFIFQINEMSEPKKMTLRVQCSEGTTRVEVESSETTAALFERVHEALGLASFAFTLHRDRQRREEVLSSKSRSVSASGLRHGDMLYLAPVNGAVLFDQPSSSLQNNNTPEVPLESVASTSAVAAPPTTIRSRTKVTVQEDEVDILLYPLSGNIQRQRDEKLCRHNVKGCCVHCTPLEPWDENYLREHNIKHMSFHSYLRKISTGNKFVSLDEISLNIKPGCTEHPPWPRGICSKCQPPPLTLLRQPYRHVDNVLLAHAAPAERFLSYWRATTHQRAGLLYGVYEPHAQVPLGIRARVEAIYEPPQTSSRDSLQLHADPLQPLVDQIAARLGLQPVGWIFTDLLPAAEPDRVQCTRGVDTHFLSAQECIMAAHFQNQHPNPCRLAASGYFGSKFVTVCVTGDASCQVHMEGYQVSGQCCSMVRAGALLPTKDAPDLAHVKPSSDAHYVPDVYYKERDAYGNEVGVLAKSVPVAYLLVDVPCGVAGGAGGAGRAGGERPLLSPAAAFPPAHRALHDQLQTLAKLHHHIHNADSFLDAMSDLHVLLYLCSNEALPLPLSQVEALLDAVRCGDAAAAERWRREPQPATLEQLAAAAADHPAHSPSSGTSEGAVWTCALCTFHNQPQAHSCEMCAMPRNSGM